MTQVIRVQAVEYRSLPRDLAGELGLSPSDVKVNFGDLPELVVLKCVDRRGRKLTAIGDPERLRRLLAHCEIQSRTDVELSKADWPILLPGWASGH